MTTPQASAIDFDLDLLAERGWVVQPDFVEADYVRALLAEAEAAWQDGDFRQARIGQDTDRQLRPEIRSDHILWLDEDRLTPLQQQYWDRIEALRQALNRHFLLGLRTFEAHLAVYPAGAFYKRHLDRFRSTPARTISCLLYLNEDWTADDGGQLRIYETAPGGTETHVDVLPAAGTFVCFRSDTVEHEVLPARRRRYSLTGWLKRIAPPLG